MPGSIVRSAEEHREGACINSKCGGDRSVKIRKVQFRYDSMHLPMEETPRAERR